MKISICILLLFTILRTYAQSQATFGQFNIINRGGFRSNIPTPFPQCLTTELGKQLFEPSALQRLFDRKLFEENTKLTQERDRNIVLNNGRISKCDRIYSNEFSSISIKMILWISMKCNYERIILMVLYFLELQPKPLKKFFKSMKMNH